DLVGVAQAALAADVEDRLPFAGEVVQGVAHLFRPGRRVADHGGPDRRPAEAGQHVGAELLRHAGAGHHLFRRPLLHAARLAVAPDVVRQDVAVAGVDGVADGVADAVDAQYGHLQFQAV